MRRRKKFLRRTESFDIQTHGLDKALDRPAQGRVVIDDEDNGRGISPERTSVILE
jgi:hypothetical protein